MTDGSHNHDFERWDEELAEWVAEPKWTWKQRLLSASLVATGVLWVLMLAFVWIVGAIEILRWF